MLVTRPCYRCEFLKETNLGVELHINRNDALPDWPQYIPFVGGLHLPYADLNLASFDVKIQEHSLQVLKKALDEGLKYKIDKMVMHSTGIRILQHVVLGEYNILIKNLRIFADYAKEKNITLCLENQVYLNPEIGVIFGRTVDEWFQIQKDVARDNFLLTLDTSHAATSVAIYDTFELRASHMFDYLARPDLIGRVHWSDSILTDNQAKYHDMHLIPGEGDLPLEFHKQINSLPVVKTLEQRRSEEDIAKGLEFIKTLSS